MRSGPDAGRPSENPKMNDTRPATWTPCPSCSEQGIECVGPKNVPEITLTHLVKPEFHKDIPAGQTFFCSERDCEMVYFDAEGREIRKHQLSVEVWQKEESGEVPVCYCFDHSAKSILEDARRHSPPTIPLMIRDKIKAGLCACDIKNLKGSCCLGDVAFWVKQAG